MQVLSRELQKYIEMTASSEILPIIQPLRHLKVTFFLFVREFASGGRLWLTNHGLWSEHFYTKKYYETSAFENPEEARPSGIFPWQCLRGQEMYRDARDNFGIGTGITLIENSSSKIDFFHFGYSTAEGDANHKLIENITPLSCFTKYFTNQAKPLIKMAEANMVNIPKPTVIDKIPPVDVTSDNVNGFFKEMGNGKFYLNSDMGNEYLTRKEVECLKWCIQGKSAEEIALILNISKRTVEAHIESAKQKLHCYKQFQLGYKLALSGFFPDFSET